MQRTQIAAVVFASSAPANKLTPSAADPLAPIAGRSVLGWVVDAAVSASIRRIAVVGDQPGLAVRTEMARRTDAALVEFVTPDGLGQVDVTALAIERIGSELALNDNAHLLLLSDATPQLDAAELRALVADHVQSGAAVTLLGSDEGVVGAEPIVSTDADGVVTSIVEPTSVWGDDVATIACVRAPLLTAALRRVTPRGWNGQPLLRDAAEALRAAGHPIEEVPREPVRRIVSASTRAPIEIELRDRILGEWIERGVSIPDPRQVSIDATVTIGQGVRVLPGTLLEGVTQVGDGAVLGPNSQIIDSTIGAGATAAHVVVDHAEVPAHEVLPPFTVRSGRPEGRTV